MNDNRPICPHCVAEVTYDDLTDESKRSLRASFILC